MLVLRFVLGESVINGLENTGPDTGLDYWTPISMHKKKLLCSPINIYVPVERVAQYTSKIAILLQRGTYLSLYSDVRVSTSMPVFFYTQRPYLNIAATYLNRVQRFFKGLGTFTFTIM